MTEKEEIKKIVRDSIVFFQKYREEIFIGINELDKETRKTVMENTITSKKDRV